MRTVVRVVIERGRNGELLNVYCNDPEAEVVYAGKADEPTIDECGCCGGYHLSTFAGDCRNDDEQFFTM